MQRRSLLSWLGLTALVHTPAFPHTPYRQWDVFRQRYLQLLTSLTDPLGDALGDQWVAQLREKLPLSRALVSRARNLEGIASLLKTNQAKLAILSYSDADAMFNGKGTLQEFSPIPLELLIDSDSHLLVTRADLPVHHGYLITAALLNEGSFAQPKLAREGSFGMALHAGAQSFARGEKIVLPSAS